MTQLAKYISNKMQKELRPAKKDLFLAKQLVRYYRARGEKSAKAVLSSPEGIATSFILGVLTARYGKFGALRKLAILKRFYFDLML